MCTNATQCNLSSAHCSNTLLGPSLPPSLLPPKHDNPEYCKRQRVYMSPRLWAELDADPQRGLALMDMAAAQQALQQQQQPQHPQQYQHQQYHQQYQQHQHMEEESSMPLATMAMMQEQEDANDDISNFFYKSSPEGLSDTNSISSTLPSSPSTTAAGRPLPNTTTSSTSSSKTTDDVLTSVYRPLLMTGNTPNSTSSIFCRNTACNPNADQIILCMSSVLQVQMLHDKQAGANEELRERFRFFEAPVTSTAGAGGGGAVAAAAEEGGEGMMVVEEEAEEEEVTVEEIHRFIEGIFKRARFSPECNIIALVYINRVISTTSLPLHPRNWKAVVLVALLLAQKVWDDRCVALSSFSQHLPDFPLERMRLVERKFLELLQYRATVTQALYTRYYFELRALFEKLLEQESISREFPLKPMAMWQARKLELCSDSFGLCTRGASSNITPASSSSSSSTGGGGNCRHPHPSSSSSSSASSTLPTRSLGGVQPHSPLEPFTAASAAAAAAAATGAAAAVGGPLRSSLLGLPPPASSSTHSSTSSFPPSSSFSTSSSRRPRTVTASGVARNSPWTPLPQSPSPTYEDVTYMPKGRYVQS